MAFPPIVYFTREGIFPKGKREKSGGRSVTDPFFGEEIAEECRGDRAHFKFTGVDAIYDVVCRMVDVEIAMIIDIQSDAYRPLFHDP